MERLYSFKGMLYLAGAFSLAGSSVIAAWFVNDHLGTYTITAVSLLLSLLFLLPLCGKEMVRLVRKLTVKEWLLCLLQALFGVFLFRVFLLNGLLHTTSAEAGILTGATPAITVFLSVFLMKEAVVPAKLLGIVSTVGGIVLIQGILEPGSQFKGDHIMGNLLVLAAAASESLFNIFSRIAAVRTESEAREPVHPIVQTTIVSTIALLLCLIPALYENPASHFTQSAYKNGLPWSGTDLL